ncbi:mRNAadenosine methylase [Wolffia australiana]
MDAQASSAGTEGGEEDMAGLRRARQRLEDRILSRRASLDDLISSVPDIIPTVDAFLRLIAAVHRRPFTPSPDPPSSSSPPPRRRPRRCHDPPSPPPQHPFKPNKPGKPDKPDRLAGPSDRLAAARTMVAVCLLERAPFAPIDSAAVTRKLEHEQSSASPAERAALNELGGEGGAVSAVETALRCIAEAGGGVELEEFVVSGKPRLMVMAIDRSRLLKELPETAQLNPPPEPPGGPLMPRPELWISPPDLHHHHHHYHHHHHNQQQHQMGGLLPIFPGPRGGGRGVMGLMGLPRGMAAVPPMLRPPLVAMKSSEEEEDVKDLEALLSKKSFMELQKSKTGEELLDLIHRPTAKETAVAAKFKTKGGSQLKEYCSNLTKEDCRRQSGSYIACEKVHFRRIIAPHTDTNLGDCSFLDTCRHMKTCKYVHYELDPTPDVSSLMMGAMAMVPPRPMKTQRAEYCSEVELGEPQWINCDIRSFRMDIIGQFGVIMADPPWDIHMELPYGTMADDEMKNLNVPALQTDGLIFLWVTGRAMELGRECLEQWGYKRVEEIIWVKTNQLQRIIRTGRTGHWLNHSKEHCLVGIKGNPEINRNIDTDVIVAEVRETSRKPDEMYPLLERISPRTRKLELFARMHNTHAGWISLGNQLNGVRLVDEGLRARFKAAYPDVEVQPASPPRASVAAEGGAVQLKDPNADMASESPVDHPMLDASGV